VLGAPTDTVRAHSQPRLTRAVYDGQGRPRLGNAGHNVTNDDHKCVSEAGFVVWKYTRAMYVDVRRSDGKPGHVRVVVPSVPRKVLHRHC
jgi:hypothetical protein